MKIQIGTFNNPVSLCVVSNYSEHYFTSASWISQTEVCVVWLNRPQNISIVTLCKSPMWYCQEVSAVNFVWKNLILPKIVEA